MEVLPWFRSPVPCENWTGLSREETDRKGGSSGRPSGAIVGSGVGSARDGSELRESDTSG